MRMTREKLDEKVEKINNLLGSKFKREGFNEGHTLYDVSNGNKTMSPHLKSKAFGEWLDAFYDGAKYVEEHSF